MLNGPQGGPHCLHSGGSPDGGAATGAFKVAVGFTKWIWGDCVVSLGTGIHEDYRKSIGIPWESIQIQNPKTQMAVSCWDLHPETHIPVDVELATTKLATTREPTSKKTLRSDSSNHLTHMCYASSTLTPKNSASCYESSQLPAALQPPTPLSPELQNLKPPNPQP